MKVHAGKCPKKDIFVVDKILDVEVETGSTKRRFLIRWKGYDPEEDRWEPRSHVPPGMIKEFLVVNERYDYD